MFHNKSIFKNLITILWYRPNLLNSLRRFTSPNIAKLKYYSKVYPRPIKLHLGSGTKHFDCYINIDWRKTEATDIVGDIKNLPFPNNSVSEIITFHVIEHLPKQVLPLAIREWNRVIKKGGDLIIEFPDFDKAAREYLNGNERRIDNIFGLQRFSGDTHLFGYNIKRLTKILRDAGFKEIKERTPRDYHTKLEPCLRIEAKK